MTKSPTILSEYKLARAKSKEWHAESDRFFGLARDHNEHDLINSPENTIEYSRLLGEAYHALMVAEAFHVVACKLKEKAVDAK